MGSERRAVFLRRSEFELFPREGDQAFGEAFIKRAESFEVLVT